eukprot:tig00000396_g24913.t1
MSREAAESLRSHEHVKLVVPDAAVRPAQAVDFTALGYGPQPWGDVVPWHLDRLDQASGPLDGRFDRGTVDGSGVDIYVVDTGVLATHPELEGRVVSLYDVDSALYAPGSELLGSDCSPESHGTAVAAAAAGRTLGAAPGATVLAVKVFARSGGAAGNCTGPATDSAVLAGLEQVLAAIQNRGRPSVTLLAMTSTSRDRDASLYTAAVASLRESGSVVITAAGNDYADGNTRGAINVGASDQDDYRAGFSNWGSCVSLFAPGQNVKSALRPKAVAGANGLPGFTASTGIFHGTSFAAGIAAGVAALYRQASPNSPLAIIEDALVNGTVPVMRSSILNNSPNRLLSVSKALLPGAMGVVGPAAYNASLFSGVEIGMCSFTPSTTAGLPSALHRQLLQWGDAYFDVASEPAKASGVFLARLRLEQDYNGFEITLRNFELTYPSLAVYIGNPTMPSYERRLYGWFRTEGDWSSSIVERYGQSIRPGTYYVLVQGNAVRGNLAGPGQISYQWGGFGNASGAFRLDVIDTAACPYRDHTPDRWTDDGTCKFDQLGTCSQDLLIGRQYSSQDLRWLAMKSGASKVPAAIQFMQDFVMRFEVPISINSGEFYLGDRGMRIQPHCVDWNYYQASACNQNEALIIITDGCPTDPTSNIVAVRSLLVAKVEASCSLVVTNEKYYTLMPDQPYYLLVEAAPSAPRASVSVVNSTRAVVHVSFTSGQSVVEVESVCSRVALSGVYSRKVQAADSMGAGVNVSFELPPRYSGSFELSCRALVRASTGLPSAWTSAAVVTVPAAAPWAPLQTAVAALNATQAVVRVSFTPGQSVSAVEMQCSGAGGPYAVNATVMGAAASGVNISVGLVPSYSGSFNLSCRALVRASSGLPSAWTSAAVVTVPAAAPWAPLALETTVVVLNAEQAAVRVSFTPGQSVSAVEMQCSGAGGPYAVNATVMGAAASGVNISVGLVPSYSGSFNLSCRALVRASTGLPSAWTSAAVVAVPAGT